MKKIFHTIIGILSIIFMAVSHAAETKQPITVGILIPAAVPAMKQIVDGFTTTLNKESKVPVTYLIKNAQGDINLQRSILQEFSAPNVTLVAPIGTDASQMAIAMIRDKPIIGIGASHLKTMAEKANNPEVTGVLDEISVAKQIAFIHQAMPQLKNLTIVYSADDRIFSDVEEAVAVAEQDHIHIQKLMTSQLSDLYNISNTISPQSQAIFIFKDEVIVSGLTTLLQTAHAKHIPVIASDDLSVKKGAAFALGVSENQLGIDAANMAAQILTGKKASEMPVHVMTHYFVFLNPNAAQKQGVDPAVIEMAAKKLGYTVTTLE